MIALRRLGGLFHYEALHQLLTQFPISRQGFLSIDTLSCVHGLSLKGHVYTAASDHDCLHSVTGYGLAILVLCKQEGVLGLGADCIIIFIDL